MLWAFSLFCWGQKWIVAAEPQRSNSEHTVSWYFVAFNVNRNPVMFYSVFVVAFKGAGKAIKGICLSVLQFGGLFLRKESILKLLWI